MTETSLPPPDPRGPAPVLPRPLAVDVAAVILVAGGLIGLSQIAVGEYVITGSLPAKAPIVGVALIAYLVSILIGFALRSGRAWLAGLNLAILTALLYLPAAGRPLFFALILAHIVAAVGLVVGRPWFAAAAAARRAASPTVIT